MEVIIAHKNFVNEKPDTVKRVIKALSESIEFINTNPSWVIEKVKNESRFSEEGAKLTLQELRFAEDLSLNKKAMENVINFCVQYGIIKKEKAPSVDEVIPKGFAR
jgi:ABC-type nitrate/sulfonate/bicarbonate transport system substrate-binding protein